MKQALGLAAVLVAGACEPSVRRSPPAQVAVAAAEPDASIAATPVPDRTSPEAAERARQIAWLRQTWPEEARGLSLESLAPRLAEWVAPGAELEAFMTVGEQHCARIVLRRAEGDAAGLDGRLISHEAPTDGGRERSFRPVDLGHWLHLESGGGSETFDGTEWVPSSGWGVGDGGTTLDVLSHVDSDVARWDGTAVRISARCAGPEEPLPCTDGGTRLCDTCKNTSLEVTAYRPGAWGGQGFGTGRVRIGRSCNEPCPKLGNPVIERVARIDSEHAWRPLEADQRPSPVPTLYRSEARCRREPR